MKNDLLKQIQNVEKEALEEFNKYCIKNDIRFFLRGGSVLGAIKYKDIVPWDDDIDVALPRNDYNKLINNCKVDFSKKFILVSYKNTVDSHCYFPRIILKEEYRVEYGFPKNNERGLVLIDILPLDGMPTNRIILKSVCI